MTRSSHSPSLGALWLAGSIFSQTAATVMLKQAGLSAAGHAFHSLLASPCYWFALIALGLQALCWIQALKIFDLSVAHPISSLSIGSNLTAAHVFFDEKITPVHLAGIALILAGVVLIGKSTVNS